MRGIILLHGEIAKVSKVDYDRLSQYNWYCNRFGYVIRSARLESGKYTIITMHRDAIGIKQGYDIHHINENRLDNQRENLMHVTKKEHRRYHKSLRRAREIARRKKNVVFGEGWAAWK